MSIEAPGLSISAPVAVSPSIGPSIGPSFSPAISLEGGPSFGPSFSESFGIDTAPSLGGTTGNFSLREMLSMPEHEVNPSNFHMDNPLPVQKMAFDDRLFETLTRVDQIPKQPNLEILHLFELPEHSLNLDNIGADTLSPVPRTIFNPGYFEIFSANPANHEEVDKKVMFDNIENLQTETLFPFDFTSETQELPLGEFLSPTVSRTEAVESSIDQITEAEIDSEAIEKIQALIEDQSFPAEQEAAWKEKFAQVVYEKEAAHNQALPQVLDNKEPQTNLITQPKIETIDQTDVDTKPQTQTETAMEMPSPNSPKTALRSESQPEEEQFTLEENIWNVYAVDRKWVIAQDLLKNRVDTVYQAVQRNTGEFSPADTLRGEIAGMDIPTPQQALKIAGSELVMPQVVFKIDRALDLVDINNTQEVAKTAQEIIQENAPSQSNKRVNLVEIVKQSRLIKPARNLADLGAKFIVLRRNNLKWEARNRLASTEPVELEKTKNKTLAPKLATTT